METTASNSERQDWKMTLTLTTVATPHVPVRYLEGGTGAPILFLHGAGGALVSDPFLNKLAEKYHVYAPLLPGYGDWRNVPRSATCSTSRSTPGTLSTRSA